MFVPDVLFGFCWIALDCREGLCLGFSGSNTVVLGKMLNVLEQIRMPVPESTWKSAMMGLYSDFETTPEYAMRLGKQLLKLTKVLCIVRSRNEVSKEDFATTTRVGFDTCPQYRLRIVLALYEKPNQTIEELSKILGWRMDKTKRKLAELTPLMDVLEADGELTDFNTKYNLSDTLRSYSKGFLPSLGEAGTSRNSVYNKYKYTCAPTTLTSGNGKLMEFEKIDAITYDSSFPFILADFIRFTMRCGCQPCHLGENTSNSAILGVSPVSTVQGVSTTEHETGLNKYMKSGNSREKGYTTDTLDTVETFYQQQNDARNSIR